MNINIDESHLDGFSNDAKRRLEQVIKNYSNDVIAESLRIESGQSFSNKRPEVTSTMVDTADRNFKQALIKRKKSPYKLLAKIVSSIAFAFTGALFNLENKSTYNMTMFTVFLLIGIFAIIYDYFNE